MAYDLPTNITNMTSLAEYANDVTSNSFWIGIFFALMVVSLAIMMSRGIPKEESFFITSIFGFILSTMLVTLGLVGSALPILFILFTGLSMVLLWFRAEKSYAA